MFGAYMIIICLNFWDKAASEWNHPEIVGSIPTTGKTNKEYLL